MSVEGLASDVAEPSAGKSAKFSGWFEKFLANTKDASDMPDEQELTRRRQLLGEIDDLRAEIRRQHGAHPDSTPMIREMRDHE